MTHSNFLSLRIDSYKNSYSEPKNKTNVKKNTLPPHVKKIFLTWHDKNSLTSDMGKNIESIKQANPSFEIRLFDDNDCRKYIQENYPDALFAFDRVIPGAYKADLWRYIVLFLEGGIYMDIKFAPVNNFSFEALLSVHLSEEKSDTSGLMLVVDQPHYNVMPVATNLQVLKSNAANYYSSSMKIYNGLMVALEKKNPVLKCFIDQSLQNIYQTSRGSSYLDPTGPGLCGKIF